MNETPVAGADAIWRATPLGRALLALAQVFALAGGLVLLAMIVMSALSVLGRKLFDTPIQGDFELVQLGCAICVACFLPYCQAQRGHVIVDFFTLKLSDSARRRLDALAALLLGACAALIAWRLYLGTLAVRESSESSMLLGVPVWWGYAPMVLAFALLAAVAFYTAWSELRTRGRA